MKSGGATPLQQSFADKLDSSRRVSNHWVRAILVRFATHPPLRRMSYTINSL